MFLPNLEHHQAQRCHKPNLVGILFLYLIILICVSYEFYRDQWSFRFICIPWVYMLEHSLRDKIQYHMSWHVEFTSNLVILKSLIFSSFLHFKSLQQWTFSVQLSVKIGLSCVNLHGFWESNRWKGGVSLQRGKVFSVFLKLCTCFFFPRHNHLFILFSSLLHSPYVVRGFKNV